MNTKTGDLSKDELLAIMQSDAPGAADVRREIITAITALKRGESPLLSSTPALNAILALFGAKPVQPDADASIVPFPSLPPGSPRPSATWRSLNAQRSRKAWPRPQGLWRRSAPTSSAGSRTRRPAAIELGARRLQEVLEQVDLRQRLADGRRGTA